MTRRVTERRMVLHMNSRGDSLQDAVGITKIKIKMAVATTPVVNWAWYYPYTHVHALMVRLHVLWSATVTQHTPFLRLFVSHHTATLRLHISCRLGTDMLLTIGLHALLTYINFHVSISAIQCNLWPCNL